VPNNSIERVENVAYTHEHATKAVEQGKNATE